jgi:hypothetical protein
MRDLSGFQRRDRRGQWFVIGNGDDRDVLQASGEWIATTHPVEVRR